ncbi:hypothetical protein Acr_04g0001230 [Actinidia rufa]|uniref:Uncharacterized protein n=1 Tax=Actinidia rufa TaxID=165716 RepID=A0A7J0EFZ6_9ERIC|nr:hypothetical protein Acr_04g0001230 [Actinidia rufa]
MALLVLESSGIIESSLTPVAPTVTLTSCLDPCTATVADTSPGPVPDLSHIQSQLGILQSQLGSLLQQQPSGSIATLATGGAAPKLIEAGHSSLGFGPN